MKKELRCVFLEFEPFTLMENRAFISVHFVEQWIPELLVTLENDIWTGKLMKMS